MLRRISVGDTQRVLIFDEGRLRTIAGPGTHYILDVLGRVRVEVHSILDPLLVSTYTDTLVKERPHLTAEWFEVVETNDSQIAIVSVDAKLNRVVPPASRMLFWKAPRAITARVMDVRQAPEVPSELVPRLARLGVQASAMTSITVPEGHAGLLYLDGQYNRVLTAGLYGYWNVVQTPSVVLYDLRRQSIEVPGQEILTKDKVSVRVNVLAHYRYADPVKAGTLNRNACEQLYRSLQLAVRQTLAKRSLDELLAEKVDVDPAAAAQVRIEMAELGVEVGTIALKDIILPGEIRDILNQVVAAEKQAQANLIRRREETAATRSLLNTAKLMEGNPLLVRLKELESLERITGKVEKLTVVGGFETLLK